MAQALPSSGRGRHTGPARTRPSDRARPPDVFGPRVHRAAAWAWPVALGLVYGYWAAANRREAGPITGWNLLFGFVTALVFIVAYVALRALVPRLSEGRHAVMWAAFAATTLGLLFSLSGMSVLRSTVLALLVGAGVFAALYYRYTTRPNVDADAGADERRSPRHRRRP
ncbi:hypothetical protein [Streptomyces sp. NPDC006610]|uniref:hypothetical protein n=1 Tax=Streptomyces sp. NPDC006610 TaxID=3154584 RepID=UPI0033AB4065